MQACINVFLISKSVISNIRLTLVRKNHAKAKQNPEVELTLSENYLLSSSSFSSKNNKDILSRAGITSATVQ